MSLRLKSNGYYSIQWLLCRPLFLGTQMDSVALEINSFQDSLGATS
ncbi:MAG: hypothetical protein PF444_04130 [Bacteroidales bacterium]|nr:hypothetical protein [Bacteroidales bacterium]